MQYKSNTKLGFDDRLKSTRSHNYSHDLSTSIQPSIIRKMILLAGCLTKNKLAKLRDAIAISESETITHSLTHPLTDRGRC